MPELFRAIIIDTPPALDYADAQVIAARAQGCLLLTTRHRTSVADVERVKETLLPTGARLLGAVLNG
jgi:Mrp family chromosome partitioning ATPase